MLDDKIIRFNDSYTSVSRLNEYGKISESPHAMQVSNNAKLRNIMLWSRGCINIIWFMLSFGEIHYPDAVPYLPCAELGKTVNSKQSPQLEISP